ncbi:MAG: PQQ-like beta-propeller repeat protein [Chloroflexi bacterium]|nr:PQQ-like beta-propeller repeat protein [Chloroflexota bacterium]
MFLRRKLSSKLFLLLLVTGGLFALSACAPGEIAKGWAGTVITDNTLFIGSMAGDIATLDAASGARQWLTPLETSKPGGGGFGFGCGAPVTTVAIYGTPAVSGNLVYIGGYVKQGTASLGKIYAYSPGRNEPRWLYPREGFLEGPVVGGIVASGGKLYFGGSDGKVYVLDAADGYKLAEFQTQDKIWSTPAVDGNTVYIGSFDKKLYALDATTLQPVKWKEFQTEGAVISTPVVHEGTIYVGSLDRYLYAVNAADGKEKGKFLAGGWFWAKPLIYNNTIYAAGLNQKLYFLATGTLAEKAPSIDLGSPVYSSPVLVGDKIYIATEEGEVYSLDTRSNDAKRLATMNERVYAPLAAGQGNIYVHTEKDNLYAVDAQTGAIRKYQIK